MAQVLTIGPDYLDIPLRDLSTGDGLLVGVDTLIEYKFDPRIAPAENDAQRARLARRCGTQAERRVLLGFLAQRAMQTVTASFRAEQICRGQVWDMLEERFFESLDKRLLPFGMQLDRLGCALQRAHPPEVLKQRFEMAAQRSINIDDLGQEHALSDHAGAALGGHRGAQGHAGRQPDLNLHDVTSTEEQAEKPKQIIDSTSHPAEPRPLDEPAAQEAQRTKPSGSGLAAASGSPRPALVIPALVISSAARDLPSHAAA